MKQLVLFVGVEFKRGSRKVGKLALRRQFTEVAGEVTWRVPPSLLTQATWRVRDGEWTTLGHLNRSLSNFLGLDEGLLGDEDAVKELALVLSADPADLLHLGAEHGKRAVVVAVEDELALDVGGDLDGAAVLHGDELVLLAAEEVLDGDAGAVLGHNHVDGEMRVDESHLVAEALEHIERARR